MATSFDDAFNQFAAPEGGDAKKPDEAAAAGSDGGAAAGAGDGAGDGAAAAGSAAVDAGQSGGADDAGAGDAAQSGDGAGAPVDAGAGGDGAGAGGADGGAAGDAAAAGSDAGAGAAAPGAEDKSAGDSGAAGAAAAPDADAILAGLKKLVGDQSAAPAATAPADTQAAPAADEKPIYSAAETERLAKYDEDWKEVAECEALKRRAEYKALLDHVFTQVVNFVKPIQETAEVLAQRTFTTDVKGAVPDYSDQLRADVIEWTKSQPTYLQVAYNHVIEEGTVDEVKDLIDRYRTATGKAKPAGAGAAPKQDGGNELSDEAKKAAAALAPVDSKRSGVSAPSDPSNFDDAWKEAANLV